VRVGSQSLGGLGMEGDRTSADNGRTVAATRRPRSLIFSMAHREATSHVAAIILAGGLPPARNGRLGSSWQPGKGKHADNPSNRADRPRRAGVLTPEAGSFWVFLALFQQDRKSEFDLKY
jgi:hypothetical protein